MNLIEKGKMIFSRNVLNDYSLLDKVCGQKFYVNRDYADTELMPTNSSE